MSKIISTFFSYSGDPGRSELELLETFVSRIHDIDPSVAIIITTDPDSVKFTAHIKAEFHVCPIARETLLLDRCKSNLELLKRFRGVRQILFCDYDIVFNALIEAEEEESLLLTVRNAKRYPINGGILAFSHPGKASISLYQTVLDQYLTCSSDDLRWWGDQVSLFQALLAHRDALLRLESFEHYNVLIRPVSTYEFNWTPFDMDVSPQTLWQNFFLSQRGLEEYGQHAVVHFKGPRKHLMMQYARSNYGGDPKNLPDWINTHDKRDLESLTAGLYNRIVSFPSSKGSVWSLADESFSLLPLLQESSGISNETRLMLSSALSALSRIHSDHRFNLIFGNQYQTTTV